MATRGCTRDHLIQQRILERDNTLVLVVEGELDISTAPYLDEALTQAHATDARTIVVDLDHVDFIDSSALHVLIKHACTEESSQRIRLTKGSPQAQRLFELARALNRWPFASED